MKLADLVVLIDEIETILKGAQMVQNADACCATYDHMDFTGGAAYTDAVLDGVGNVPQNIIDAGYATGVADWAGYASYKCMVSYLIVSELVEKLDRTVSLMEGQAAAIGGLATVAALLSSAGITIATGGSFIAVAGLVAALGALTSALVEEMKDEISAHSDEFACAIYMSDGTEGAIAAFEDKLDEYMPGIAVDVIQGLFIDSTIRAYLGGRYDQEQIAQLLADNGYVTGNYSCTLCDDPLAPDEREYTWVFAANLDGISSDRSIQWVSFGAPDGSARLYNFGVFNEGELRIQTEDMSKFGDLTGYTKFKVIHVRTNVQYDLPGAATGTFKIVFGSPIFSSGGKPQDTWTLQNYNEAQINDPGGHSLSSIIWGIRLGHNLTYPNVPNQIWTDNLRIRIRLHN